MLNRFIMHGISTGCYRTTGAKSTVIGKKVEPREMKEINPRLNPESLSGLTQPVPFPQDS